MVDDMIYRIFRFFSKRYFCLLGLAGLFFISCEKKEIIFRGPYFVRFTEPTAASRESNRQPVRISVHNVGPQLNEPITVTYVVGGSAREGVDYRIEGTRGTVIIPAKQSFGYVTLQLINNANNILESQDVVFTITGVTPGTLGIGTSKEGIIGKRTTFTIQDDCILSGTYFATRAGGGPPVENITVTSMDCQDYVVSNWNANISELGNPWQRSLRFVDNGDNTLRIPSQRVARLPDSLATVQGNGSVNPVTRRITLNVQLINFKNSPTYQITYVPE